MTMELTTEQLMNRYERLRNEDMYKDVTLTSHDSVVSAHKCILSVGSEFFNLLFKQAERKRDMFHRSSFELVGLSAEDAKHLDAVIDFLYSGFIYINNVNFTAIIKLADYLAIEELFDLGEKYLELNITKENCLKMYLDMKKAFNGEMVKGGSSSNRKSEEMLKMIWETVETNFYDHVIDHHEFLEVIPEEIEEMLQRKFDTQKVLNLAVRWMKTWPLGFTFAETLVNLTHGQVNAVTAENLADKCKADIVALVTTIREQIRSRTIPQNNKKIILKKLGEIQKIFDAYYVDIDVDEKKDSRNNKTKEVNMETDFIPQYDKGKQNMDNSNSYTNNDNNSDKLESVADRSQGQTNGDVSDKIDRVSTGFGYEPRNRPAINSHQKKTEENKSKENLEGIDTESENGNESMAKSNRSDILAENMIINVEEYIVNKSGDTLKDSSVEDKDGIVIDEIKEEGYIEMTGQEVRGHRSYFTECVELIERKKLDGTEVEVSVSGDNSDSNKEKVEEGETTLHDRVAECLKLQRVVKKEDNIIGSQPTTVKPIKGKRKRGRPKKHVEPVFEEDKLKQETTLSTGSRTRGVKRKIVDYNFGMSESDVEDAVVKVEIREGQVIMDDQVIMDEEGYQDVDADYNKDARSEAEGDSEDDYSEDVFAEALKKGSGLDLLVSENSKLEKKRSPRKPGHHECEICNKVYTQKYRLTQHMNMHLGIKPYKCVVCLQNFSRSDHVVRHMKSQHGDLELFKCDECDEEFEKVNEVVTHSLIHIPNPDYHNNDKCAALTEAEKEFIAVSTHETGKPEYSCIKCNQIFRRPYQAREHINFHTGEKPFKCSSCDNSFAKKETLTAHVRSVHEGKKKGEFKCVKCRRFFMRKESYDTHIEKCVPNYVCNQCPMKFYRKTHLDNHKSVHDLVPQHKCSHCENTYRYRKHMLRHIRKDHLHEEEAQVPCICDICGVVVKNKEALYRHKKVHKMPDKECDVCGKAFKDNTTLKDHKLMHTNVRDYQCEICSMLFARKGNLIRHQKRHRGERKYRCEMCGMCFVANCDLTRHKNTHLGVKKFPCRYCGRKFSLKSKVVIHERTHTGERPYVCRDEECGKTFKQTGDRVRHEKKVHSLSFNKYMTLYELATGKSEDIYRQSDNTVSPNKVTTLPVNPSIEITANLNTGTDMNMCMDLSSNQVTVLSALTSSEAGNMSERPVNDGTPSQTSGPSSSESVNLNVSSSATIDKSIVNAATASFNPNMNNSYIEEAEMSKIFQRTVAAISQEAIAKSGIYN